MFYATFGCAMVSASTADGAVMRHRFLLNLVFATGIIIPFVAAEAEDGNSTTNSGASVLDDRDGNSIGVVADIFGVSQTSAPLAGVKTPNVPLLILLPVSELLPKGAGWQYIGTKAQFDTSSKRRVALLPGTNSSSGTAVREITFALAVPSVSVSFSASEPGGNIVVATPPDAVEKNDNPFSRAGSDIKGIWGGASSIFRKPF